MRKITEIQSSRKDYGFKEGFVVIYAKVIWPETEL
jgi:hypothetical protein